MKKFDLNKNMKIHLIGINGVGVSSIANVLFDMGFRNLTGSDVNVGENSDIVKDKGVQVFSGGNPELITSDLDLVIYTVSAKNGQEFAKVKSLDIPFFERAEFLNILMNQNGKEAISISGTHGKTSTTSMMGVLLEKCAQDPTVINGGIIDYFKSNSKTGMGKYIVAEACEAYGNIRNFHQQHCIVLNLESEHMEFYKTFEGLKGYFKEFVKRTVGYKVLCLDDVNLKDIALELSEKNLYTYSLNDTEADFYAENIGLNSNGQTFDFIVKKDGVKIKDINLKMFGIHNISNCISVLALAYLFGLDNEKMRLAVESFSGVKHRFTIVGKYNGALIIDDYAHHPTEIQAAIKTAKQITGQNDGKVIGVFQPHKYSRFKDCYDEFLKSFDLCDTLFVMDVDDAYVNEAVYEEKNEPIPNSRTFINEISKTKKNISYIKDDTDLQKYIIETASNGDVVLFMGAGNIKKRVYKIYDKIKNKFDI